MTQKLLGAWHDLRRVIAREREVLTKANDKIADLNHHMISYREAYNTALRELEDAVQDVWVRIPSLDDDGEVAKSVDYQLARAGLDSIAQVNEALEELSFSPYDYDPIDDLEVQTDLEEYDEQRPDTDNLETILNIVKGYMPDKRDPFAPVDRIPAEDAVSESMVLVPETQLRALLEALQAKLPPRS